MFSRVPTLSKPCVKALFAGSSRTFSAVPIGKVARVVRLALDGEEAAAVKVEGQLTKLTQQLGSATGPKGYLKTNRYLCKGEWVYEISYVFDSLDNFKAYCESDFKKEFEDPIREEMLKSAKAGSIYEGARVYDEFE
mmetsp:Transcript_13505/g.15389  ORF Transcript_13505/g.15389 Transcript_13505/m.15389 type:complete len:137 (+) Transcript_13505:181-591(+)|eukprot:CAMPEP_0184039992 /NCGR_PEP_ID=MMETSP0955-20130417/55472_1 /TAXON_ID=627963 /ORGANISM="Aplanochytrium sp, Strain PBS07" /LENGTH=136 /DNA_ID=CAMNT_0026329527 /DNA_START=152 /DNA_END=562 /DNA_ORIENTATION=-